MRDRLPEYVLGALSASERAEVEAHVERCADCADEVALIRAADRAFVAPRVDVAAIVAALPAPPALRLVRGGGVRGPARRGWYLAAAASLLVVVGAWSVMARRSAPALEVAMRADAETLSVAPSAPALPGLMEDETVPAFTLEQPVRQTLVPATAESLSNAQLQRLIDEMDEIETLPLADPDPDGAMTLTTPDRGNR
jgi:anti-sigma factor RsiW